MNSQCFLVDEEMEGTRLDVYLAEMMDAHSRSYLQKLIKDGHVSVNDKQQKVKYLVLEGDLVSVLVPEPIATVAKPENIPLDVVYEDAHLLVVNKPQNMVVHPAAGNETGTLVNALLHHSQGSLSSINGVIRPGIVHRIDKDTSGLLVVAKDDVTHRGLALQLADHSMKRCYVAIVMGIIPEDKITIDAPIGRHPHQRQNMAVRINGKSAVTHLRIITRFNRHTYLEATLETGRTHQIRVHLAYIKHPITGDSRYGGQQKQLNLNQQVLHAKCLGFVHPVTGENLFFESHLPTYFHDILQKLKTTGDI